MKKEQIFKNYLEKCPERNSRILWKVDHGLVILEVENKGFCNRVCQKLLKKPKISYVHLDEIGSNIWLLTDGERDIIKIGERIYEKFGDSLNPLYERLSIYFKILNSYGFIKL